VLKQFRRNYVVVRTDSAHDGIRKYRASQKDCQTCELKSRCCPNMLSRNVQRSVHEEARDHARQLAGTPQFERSRNERKKVEILFAHLKTTMRFERMRAQAGAAAASRAMRLRFWAMAARRNSSLAPVSPRRLVGTNAGPSWQSLTMIAGLGGDLATHGAMRIAGWLCHDSSIWVLQHHCIASLHSERAVSHERP
jgi:Transposase DDE domain